LHTISIQPLVSVVTVVYNGEKYLEQTIRSVLDQTYLSIEYIIIDGGSKDGSLEIIQKYSDRLAYWISEPDSGIYDAWNKALTHTKGEWICFIGADDYFWQPTTIANMLPYLQSAQQRGIRYVYGSMAHLHAETSEVFEIYDDISWEKSKPRFRYLMNIIHCGSFHHRLLFEEHGKFDPSFRIAGDYEFLLREFKNGDRDALFAKEVIVLGARNGGISANLDQRLHMARENELARQKNGITEFSKELFIWKIRIHVFLWIDKLLGRKLSAALADFYRVILGKGKRWSN